MRKNYLDVVRMLKSISLQHPLVNDVYYNIYRAQDTDNICYGAVIITPNSVTSSTNTVTYGFNIMYVDRLMEDASNELEIQSCGIDLIRQICNIIYQSYPDASFDQDFTANVFTRQFADNCAGAVATISLTIPSQVGECAWYKYCDECA